MTWFPDARLLRVGAACTAATLLLVLWPWLWAAVAGAWAVLAVLAAWDAVLLVRTPPVQATRALPERAFVNRDAEIGLVLRNDAAVLVEADVVDEVPGDLGPAAGVSSAGPLPYGSLRGFKSDGRPGGADPCFTAVQLAPHAQVTLGYRVRPLERGDRRLGTLVVLARSPLGFWRRRGLAGAGDVVRVYPDVARFLRPAALDPARVLAALGVRPAARRGEGMEFESMRDYVPGDDPRHIDWAASARRGRTVTRLYQHEHNHTLIVAVDSSRLMASQIGRRTKLDHAIDAVLALAYAALVSGDRVGMTVFDRAVHGHVAPRARSHNLGVFIDLLRAVQPRRVEADYRALVHSLAVRQRQRALILIVTDFVEADAASVTEPLMVLARRHRVLVVAMRDRLYDALEPGEPVAAEAPLAFYRRLVLNDLLEQREAVLGRLRQAGVQTLDLVPERATATVLNRYLAMRYGPER